MHIHKHTYAHTRNRTYTIPAFFLAYFVHVYRVLLAFLAVISGMDSRFCAQDWILAFMMGTHARLNADSPLQPLDDHLVASIAQMAMADRWCVHACTFVLNSMHSNMYLCPDNGNTALVYLVLTCTLACIPDSDG